MNGNISCWPNGGTLDKIRRRRSDGVGWCARSHSRIMPARGAGGLENASGLCRGLAGVVAGTRTGNGRNRRRIATGELVAGEICGAAHVTTVIGRAANLGGAHLRLGPRRPAVAHPARRLWNVIRGRSSQANLWPAFQGESNHEVTVYHVPEARDVKRYPKGFCRGEPSVF